MAFRSALTREIAAPAIIESMPNALFVVDMRGKIVIVNPHASKLTRVAGSEMAGRQVTRFIPKAAGLIVEASEHPTLGPIRSETEAALKDGRGGTRPVVLSAMPILDDRGAPIGVSKLKEQVAVNEAQKAELQKTVAQMGKIQERLVGRELRMIELKKEIAKLRKG